ncbi:hypothetical protein SAMN04488131_11449 [Flavobacterium xueshanense]|uniref:Uncharacterized protein n=2 Tax=Flavobacterium xueshanense TaxID=935223 RepID=A0A1I2HKN5_9FLAO|nr:hypothetical protein SAMN04488131_11449 [Flavobacterium xueshanense]
MCLFYRKLYLIENYSLRMIYAKFMKLFKIVFFSLMIFVLGIFNAFAANHAPPSPTGRRRPPPPPGLPIDENILTLMLVALVLGIYIIYRFKLKQKTPI